VSVHVFGIRHHGPGSARSLLRALESLAPDLVLVEGPPEADTLLSFAAHAEMRPPVALLVYDPADPRRGGSSPSVAVPAGDEEIDRERAAAVLPLITLLLGVDAPREAA